MTTAFALRNFRDSVYLKIDSGLFTTMVVQLQQSSNIAIFSNFETKNSFSEKPVMFVKKEEPAQIFFIHGIC